MLVTLIIDFFFFFTVWFYFVQLDEVKDSRADDECGNA